jgi:zinc protease
LKPDPAITFGALDNAMRYEILKNSYPLGRVSLRLRIAVGSRDEQFDKTGIAHFLEHMAYRGSTHFADGDVVKRLSALGVKTGADANASTSETETVFRIDLPANSSDLINTALSILRDIASNLSLNAEAVESERKVVLSEARLTDTPAQRMNERRATFVLSAVGEVSHPAIGRPDVIASATASQIGAFYQRFYRPERATLIVVGDADPTQLAAQIGEAFNSWHGLGDAPGEYASDKAAGEVSDTRIEFEPGQLLNFAHVYWVRPRGETLNTEAGQRQSLAIQVGVKAINRRYGTVEQGENPPFISADLGTGPWSSSADATMMGVDFAEGKWREALVKADSIRRAALTTGITQSEADVLTVGILEGYRLAVEHSSIAVSALIADGLVRDLNDNQVSQSASQRLQRAQDVLPGIQASSVDAALKTVFQGRGPLLFFATTLPIPGGDEELRQALMAAESAPLQFVQVHTVKTWPYTKFGRPGKISRTQRIADLDTTMLTFANGVLLNFKHTDFAKNQIIVTVSVGRGQQDMPRDRPSQQWAILNAFIRGGLKGLDYPTMQTLLSDKQYGAFFTPGPSSFTFIGSTRPADLHLQLQVIAAYCTAPAFRPAAFEQSRSAHLEIYTRWQSEPLRELQLTLGGLLRSGDARFLLPTTEELRTARIEELRELLLPSLARHPIEVTIVGDVDAQSAIHFVGDTFGAMKLKTTATSTTVPFGAFPPASATPVTLYHEGGEDQGAASIAWPTVDMLSDTRRFYALAMLAEIMNARLFERLRAVLGTGYAVTVASSQSEFEPEGGIFHIETDISPDNAHQFFEEVSGVVADLRINPVSQEELDRAKNPRIARLTASLSTNGLWSHWLTLAQRDPRRLDFPRHAMSDLKSVSAEDIERVANEYLADETAWRAVMRKKPASGPDNTGKPGVGP